MIWHRYLCFRITPIFIIIAILFCFNGCSNTNAPTEEQGKTRINQMVAEYMSDYVNLKNFKKSDGQASEDKGVKGYNMTFQADFEVIKNCFYYGFPGMSRESVAFEEQSHLKEQMKNGFSNISHMWGRAEPTAKKKGEIVIVNGVLRFEKTEKGWQCVGVKFVNK